MLAPGSYLIESSLRTIEEALMGDPIPALIAKQPEGGPSLHIVPESSAKLRPGRLLEVKSIHSQLPGVRPTLRRSCQPEMANAARGRFLTVAALYCRAPPRKSSRVAKILWCSNTTPTQRVASR